MTPDDWQALMKTLGFRSKAKMAWALGISLPTIYRYTGGYEAPLHIQLAAAALVAGLRPFRKEEDK